MPVTRKRKTSTERTQVGKKPHSDTVSFIFDTDDDEILLSAERRAGFGTMINPTQNIENPGTQPQPQPQPQQPPGPKREVRRCSDPARAQNLWDAIKAVRMQKQIPAITRMSRYMNRFYQIKKGKGKK